MQSKLRNRIAAAALLLSPLAVLVAQPAFARDWQEGYVVAPAAEVAPSYDPLAQQMLRHGYRRDERAPDIVELSPGPGDRSDRRRVLVGARFADNWSGVDMRSARLRIDGRDVTGYSRIDNDEIRFRDELPPGRHVAEVAVRDRAGNWARRSWQFDVFPHRGWGDRYGYDNRGYDRDGDSGRWGWQR